jgi:hypothetical protein
MFPNKPILYVVFAIEVIVGMILVSVGFFIDPAEMLDDNMTVQHFLWMVGAVLMFGASTAAGVIYFIGSARRKLAEKLKMRGLRGTAKIMGVNSTGRLNNLKRVEIELEVSVYGRPPYKVYYNDYVTKINNGKMNKDAVVNVLVDPDNNKKLIIQW